MDFFCIINLELQNVPVAVTGLEGLGRALGGAIVNGRDLLVVNPVEEQRLQQVLVNLLDQRRVLVERGRVAGD